MNKRGAPTSITTRRNNDRAEIFLQDVTNPKAPKHLGSISMDIRTLEAVINSLNGIREEILEFTARFERKLEN